MLGVMGRSGRCSRRMCGEINVEHDCSSNVLKSLQSWTFGGILQGWVGDTAL
jgi:hypothetical protein